MCFSIRQNAGRDSLVSSATEESKEELSSVWARLEMAPCWRRRPDCAPVAWCYRCAGLYPSQELHHESFLVEASREPEIRSAGEGSPSPALPGAAGRALSAERHGLQHDHRSRQ